MTNSAKCYGVYDDDNIVAFMGVIHQPHGVNKKIKRVTRLVVLPDYQGIGIGRKFLNAVARKYKKLGYDFSIVTSAKNLIKALNADHEWVLQKYARSNCTSNKSAIDYKRQSLRLECKTASFFYVGNSRKTK